MVSLKPPPTDWTDAIAISAERFQDAIVCLYWEDESDGDYDPITGEGSEHGIRVLWSGEARVQQLRAPSPFATDYGTGANRAFRFQAPRDAGIPFLPEGVKARVLFEGKKGDPHLKDLVYVVNSAINGSHQAVKTIELTATMRKVNWTWSLDEDGNVVHDGG